MRFEEGISVEAALAELGGRVAAERLARNLTQQEVAREAGVTRNTLVRLEGGGSVGTSALVRVLSALGAIERLEVAFPPTPVSPVEQLRLAGQRRRRARPRRERPQGEGAWEWGE
jgi:putative transcriptional regulator